MGVLNGKVALVTGGASGIGRAIAVRCAAEGAHVVIADIQDGAAAIADTEATGHGALFRHTDVSSGADVAALIAWTLTQHRHLDVVVTAAGISGGTGSTTEYGEADFDRVIATNLKAVFLCMHHAIPALCDAGGGAIVAIASVMGLVGLPFSPAYCAAKGGVIQLAKTAALEYAPQRIRVNCICPGMIDTPMVHRIPAARRQQFLARQPLSRLGTADEIAAATVFLASDASAFTTGAALVVDGGYTAQ